MGWYAKQKAKAIPPGGRCYFCNTLLNPENFAGIYFGRLKCKECHNKKRKKGNAIPNVENNITNTTIPVTIEISNINLSTKEDAITVLRKKY